MVSRDDDVVRRRVAAAGSSRSGDGNGNVIKRSGSLNELRPAREAVFKERPGLLRRVFTGSRRKRGKRFADLHILNPAECDTTLTVHQPEG
ncbi:hypothetical protein BV898_03551 [Hypsibius exemplaris]|uniref:Uncharacterized protein n=1 Tax=Hypsibius exemplaris TaxID=2072580 RepID=A0A1W0X4T5_HYPEX|nr:hypothetical protein BV898_03551 [Hypsibius exemplaris]